jgi:hypothetical protein
LDDVAAALNTAAQTAPQAVLSLGANADSALQGELNALVGQVRAGLGKSLETGARPGIVDMEEGE